MHVVGRTRDGEVVHMGFNLDRRGGGGEGEELQVETGSKPPYTLPLP